MTAARMAAAEAPERRRPLPEEVADHILDWLRQEGLGAKDRLPSERELATRLSVGRSTVREALQRLRRMGLVEVRQGGRMRVAQPTAEGLIEQIAAPAKRMLAGTPGSLEDLKEARLLLEVAIVRLAAVRADATALAELAACQDRLRACALEAAEGPAGFDVFLASDMAFHAALARATGNGVLAAVALAATGFLAEFHTGLVRLSGAEGLTIREHEAILVAVTARDADAAEVAMRAHLTRANALYRLLEVGSR
jgi:DNA-binding FadR family transcriptional regulator